MFMTGLITGGVIGTAFGVLISSLCVISKSGFDIEQQCCQDCEISKDTEADRSYRLDCPGAKKNSIDLTTRRAEASHENKSAPKMKTREEIEQHLKKVQKEPHAMEYIKALRWVLGQEV